MSKIAEKNKHFMQRYHALLMPLLLALLSYAGVDGYGKVQEMRAAEATPITLTVNTPAAPASEHVDRFRSNSEIDARIEKMIEKARKNHECKFHGDCG